MEKAVLMYLPEKDGVVRPEYKHVGDSGMDIRSIEKVIIGPGETKLIHTGIRLGIPKGYEVQIRPRSGVSLKTNLHIANSPGTIDSSYTGELGIIVRNLSQKYIADEKSNYIMSIDGVENCEHATYIIPEGFRIAQMVVCKVEEATLIRVENEDELKDTSRGGGGFGSTGLK